MSTFRVFVGLYTTLGSLCVYHIHNRPIFLLSSRTLFFAGVKPLHKPYEGLHEKNLGKADNIILFIL